MASLRSHTEQRYFSMLAAIKLTKSEHVFMPSRKCFFFRINQNTLESGFSLTRSLNPAASLCTWLSTSRYDSHTYSPISHFSNTRPFSWKSIFPKFGFGMNLSSIINYVKCPALWTSSFENSEKTRETKDQKFELESFSELFPFFLPVCPRALRGVDESRGRGPRRTARRCGASTESYKN